MHLLLLFLFYCSIQPFISFILFLLTKNTLFFTLFPISKEIFFILIFAFMLLSKKISLNKLNNQFKYSLIFFTIYLFINICNVFSTNADITYILINIRRQVELFLFTYLTSLFIFEKNSLQILNKFLYFLICFITLFGLIFYFIPTSLYESLIMEYISLNPVTAVFITEESMTLTQTSWYSHDLFFLYNRPFLRFVSTYLDPTTLGAFAIFSFTWFNYTQDKNKKRKRIALILSFILGIMCFSKAFILSLFINLFFKIINKYKAILYIYIIISIIVIILLFSTFNVIFNNEDLGALSHLKGFLEIPKIFISHPFGVGLGNAGNATVDELSDLGGESGIGNMASQIGIFSIIPLIMFYFYLKGIEKLYIRINSSIYKFSFVMFICWFMSFLLSASSLGFNGNIFFFVMLGIINSNSFINSIKNETENKI